MALPGPGGPRVVALGGGHGLAASLTAVRAYAGDITAIVSSADDGGSSGRLRQAFDLPAPGDLRRCLTALAEPGSPWAAALEHRFDAGELEGHALGTLLIAGLAEATGDFLGALDQVARLVGAVGRVLPAATEPVVLKAHAGDGEVCGQTAVMRAGRISAVALVPADAQPPPAALEALERADQVVLGPGSLFTSVLAAAVVPALREALASTRATRVYVCNLREQTPETAGYDVAAHVAALTRHGVDIDVVLCHPGGLPTGDLAVRCVERPVARPGLTAHDPGKLAVALADLIG